MFRLSFNCVVSDFLTTIYFYAKIKTSVDFNNSRCVFIYLFNSFIFNIVKLITYLIIQYFEKASPVVIFRVLSITYSIDTVLFWQIINYHREYIH